MSTDPRYPSGHAPGEEKHVPTPQESAQAISESRARLIEDLRNHVRSQIEIWKQVPAWALEASNRGCLRAKLELAYMRRAWPVMMRGQSTTTLAVHCDTGDLIMHAAIKDKGEIQMAGDAIVLPFALDLESLDADTVLKGLKLIAREADESMGGGITAEAAREDRRKKHDLKKPQF